MNKKQIIKLSLAVMFVISLVVYGFYDKYKKQELYKDFRANKKIMCGDVTVQKGQGWKIKNNRFFTNGKTIKTIVFCEGLD